ncbi:MAG: hypothetical protein WC455_05830, partial [Dehalococcoidia bacterium]
NYTLTITTSGNGSGTFTPASGTSYPCGTVVNLNASPNACSTFSGWSGSITNSSANTTITMDGAKSVTANFSLNNYTTLTITTSGSGSGTFTPASGTSYPCGTVVNLNASPNACSTFSGWSGSITNSSANTTITMDGAKSVTANFSLNNYTLTITTSGSGSGTFTPASGTSYPCGTVVNLNASPNACSTFSGWSGSITNSSANTTITMDGAKSVTANFSLIQYTLNISSGGNGSAAPSGETFQGCNDSVPIIATANSGYKFLNWSGPSTDSVSNVNAASTTIFMNGSKTIQANFVVNLGDINGDGHVNVLDMIRIGQHWGETGSPGWIPEDVNNDGSVNVLDMIVIGQHWTG